MSIHCCRFLPILVLSGLLPAISIAHAALPSTAALDEDFSSTYPQVVRLRYVEGDVRISRGSLADKEQGKEGAKPTGWEQAASDLAIESGYSLVTGKGRAEIEFEDASTVYLADNSVLSFTELSTTGGVPYTQVALIAGTATLNVRTTVPGELFKMTTPTDTISLNYPRRAIWRIDSYLDAVSITPQQDLAVRELGMPAAKSQGLSQTQTFRNSRLVATPVLMDKTKASDWDNWVAGRIAARDAAISAAMKDAGLSAPIPGLAEMNGQGKFFACAPYGTCWEPAKGWGGKATDVALTETKPEVVATQDAQPAQATSSSAPKAAPKAKKNAQTATDAYLANHPGADLWTEDYLFPCSAFGTRELFGKDPVTGKEQLIWSDFETAGFPFMAGYPYRMGYGRWGFGPFWGFGAFASYDPWDWAVCHSGSWIRWHHHYAWVAGTNRHHVPPVHWVQGQRTIGYVPIHPWDRAGKQPGNLKDGIFRMTHKGESIQRVVDDNGAPVKLLAEPPKEFRKPELEPLKIAETPKAEAHSAFHPNRTVAAGAGSGVNSRAANNGAGIARGTALLGSTSVPEKSFAARDQGTPINFDRRSQSFSVERPVIQGGRPTTVVEPIGGGRGGNYQPGNNGSYAGRNSNTGAYNGGGGSSRTSAPSYNGGGGSRSYTPSPSYNGGGGGNNSRPSAPAPSSAPSPAPAPSSGGGGGSSAPSGGSSPHK